MLYEILELAIMLAFFIALTLVIAILLKIYLNMNAISAKLFDSVPQKATKQGKKAKTTQEIEQFKTLMKNIDTYNGTDLGQEEI